MNALSRLKRTLFPKGVRRELENLQNRLFRRCSQRKLAACFERLGLPPGACICVHSMLSGLGYLVDGPRTVIDALNRSVPGCTIMMPSFPFSGSAKQYLDLGEVFDRDRTPSQSGLLTETLRNLPGARRSLHPTHPCVALGPDAAALIEGSERSVTPFGDDSSYGRFAARQDAYLLLVHTNNTSLVHRMQEMVEMPNLFLDGLFPAKSVLAGGAVADYPVRLHTPMLPLFVAEEGQGGELEYLWFPDYVLLFPQYNYDRVRLRLEPGPLWDRLVQRHQGFLERGICRVARLGDSEIMAIKVGPWLKEINRDIRTSIERYPEAYRYEQLAEMQRLGRLAR